MTAGAASAPRRGDPPQPAQVCLPPWMTLAAGLAVGAAVMAVLTGALAQRQRQVGGERFSDRIEEIHHVWREVARLDGESRLREAERACELADRLLRDYARNATAENFWRRARLIRGEAYLHLQRPDDRPAALKDFQAASSASYPEPENADLPARAWFGEGRVRALAGEYAEAVAVFDRLLAANPSYGAAYVWRARVHRRLGSDAQAEQDERHARRLGAAFRGNRADPPMESL